MPLALTRVESLSALAARRTVPIDPPPLWVKAAAWCRSRSCDAREVSIPALAAAKRSCATTSLTMWLRGWGIALESGDGYRIVTISFERSDDACDDGDVVAVGDIHRRHRSKLHFKRVYVMGTGRAITAGTSCGLCCSGCARLSWTCAGVTGDARARSLAATSSSTRAFRSLRRPAPPTIPCGRRSRRRTCGGDVQNRVLRFRHTSSARSQGLARTYRVVLPASSEPCECCDAGRAAAAAAGTSWSSMCGLLVMECAATVTLAA